MTAALEGVEWSAARPGRTLPPGKTRYPFYRRLGGPQGRSGRAKNLVPTGIRSLTVQLVVSRYTNWATRPTLYISSPDIMSLSIRRHIRHLEGGGISKYFIIWNFSSQSIVVSRPYPGAFQEVTTNYTVFRVVSARLKCLVYIAV